MSRAVCSFGTLLGLTVALMGCVQVLGDFSADLQDGGQGSTFGVDAADAGMDSAIDATLDGPPADRAGGVGSSGGGSSSSSSGSSSSGSSSSGSSSSGSSSSGSSSSSGGTGDGEAGSPPMTLCTAPNVPAGCVQCISDGDCPTKATPKCVSNACVQCVTSMDCGQGETPVCFPDIHTCEASCLVDGGTACETASATPICDATSGACVGSRLGGSDCGLGARVVCSPLTQQCVQCVTSSDCAATVTPLCDTSNNNNNCVSCLTNADCVTSIAGPVCRQATHTCVAGCVRDTQCADAGVAGVDAAAPRCNLTTNACVQCISDTDCTIGTPFCETAAAGVGVASAQASRCQQCLPSNVATDAGMAGCDGGPGSNCLPAVGVGNSGQFVCR